MFQRTSLAVRLSLDADLPLTVPRFGGTRALTPPMPSPCRTGPQRQPPRAIPFALVTTRFFSRISHPGLRLRSGDW
jgi:hypothetical protein